MTGAATAAALDPDRAWSGFKRHHAFIVGIDNYRSVAPLRTAVNDATRLAEVLREQHGFEVHGPLLDATGAQLRELLQTTLTNEVRAGDRVLFYFAGHGVAADGEDGPAGYLVPADAEKTDLATYIPMADLQAALDTLPCKHLLLVLDCCFSGAFKWSTKHRAITGLMPKRIYAQRFARFVDDPARQILTSAAYDQKALDVLNGQATGERGAKAASDGRLHSPFALALFDALAGEADVKLDREGDGVITATEIYSFIRDRIEPATIKEGARLRQTPSFFPLKGHDKGEFMFRNPRHRFNMPPMQGQSPFKGLASFDESDRHLFYGRDRVVADLAKRATDKAQRLLVVVGPSGTGKSSVIKAGLMPQLKDDGLAVVVMRPGAHPLAELDKTLADGTGPVVLIIDQYEELITRCADVDGERGKFDLRLHELLGDGDRVARIVITVRSDFEPQLNGGALKEAWRAGRFTVPPFSLDELRQVIVMPTIQEVMIFEPEALVDQIIGEVVQSPGALPLLSYTLSELFQAYVRRGGDKRDLTLADYEQLGGVMGALRTKADALYRELASDDERDIMRKIMLRMVSVEGELAGRRVPVGELAFANVDPALVSTVTERLVDARLVVRNEDGIEPAHDALVRAWVTLRDWIRDAGRDNLILGEQLQIATEDHLRTGQPDYLWNNNPNLPMVRKLAEDTRRCWFNRDEIAFIDASVRLKTRRLRVAIGTAAVLFAIVTGLMVWGWIEQGRATGSISAARNFTDEMLGNMMKKLRAVQRTEEARDHLVKQIKSLHGTLTTSAGAGHDANTMFWAAVVAGDIELDNGRLDTARAHYGSALKTADELRSAPAWQRNLSIAHGLLGDLARRDKARGANGDVDTARTHYDAALAIDEDLRALDDSALARRDLFISYYRLADLERRDGNTGRPGQGAAHKAERNLEARRRYEQALPLARRLVADQPEEAEAQRDLTMVLLELGNVAYTLSRDLKDDDGDRALAHYDEALQLAKRWPDAVLKHKDMQDPLALGLGRLAKAHLARGATDPARDAAQQAIQVQVARSDAEVDAAALAEIQQRQRARLLNLETLGDVEQRAGRPADARFAYRQALQIAEREAAASPAGSVWHRFRYKLLMTLAEVEVAAGQRRAARQVFGQAQTAAASPQEQRLAAACAAAPRVPCR